ncbi:MAG: hypothetical protein RLZZ90_1132 [Actinomycetota bacterium]
MAEFKYNQTARTVALDLLMAVETEDAYANQSGTLILSNGRGEEAVSYTHLTLPTRTVV